MGIKQVTLPCRHCKRRQGDRGRKLCQACYEDVAIRSLYPVSKYTAKEQGDHNRTLPPPPLPTSHLPGTPGKIEDMAERAAKGLAIWHPLDLRHDLT